MLLEPQVLITVCITTSDLVASCLSCPHGVETYNSLLVFSSEEFDLELEEEVIDMESDIGNGKDENLDGEQEDLVRYKLCGLQCEG
jgi:hypothetical protein